jgi:hypothetical protein
MCAEGVYTCMPAMLLLLRLLLCALIIQQRVRCWIQNGRSGGLQVTRVPVICALTFDYDPDCAHPSLPKATPQAQCIYTVGIGKRCWYVACSQACTDVHHQSCILHSHTAVQRMKLCGIYKLCPGYWAGCSVAATPTECTYAICHIVVSWKAL